MHRWLHHTFSSLRNRGRLKWKIFRRCKLDLFYGWVGSHLHRQHNELMRFYDVNWSKIWGGGESGYISTKIYNQSGLIYLCQLKQAVLCCLSKIFTSSSTMSSNNCCSGNYSSCSLGCYCYILATLSTTLYSTGVNCGDALGLPNQNRTWLLDNFPDTCGKRSSYQQSSCVPTTYKTSCYPSITYCVSRPCRSAGCFPISSYLYSFCQLSNLFLVQVPNHSHFGIQE